MRAGNGGERWRRRVQADLADGTHWSYGYDMLDQLESGTHESDSRDGAGGGGGCLWVRDHLNAKTCFPACDGNGNIVTAVDESAATVATRTYDPFGNLIAESGRFSSQLPLGFSSKYTDHESGLLYYGYRYYNPGTGRWLSRDPIGEEGGLNLYGMVGNNPVNWVDYVGLQASSAAPGGGALPACCCVESVDAMLAGAFEGGKTMDDYYPDLKGTGTYPTPGTAGPWNTSKRSGANVQITSKTTGPQQSCKFEQWLWVEYETINGKDTGRAGNNYDDISKSGRDPSTQPFRQDVGGSPSMADPPSYPNQPNTHGKRWFTTCVQSGGTNASTCKNKKCCVKWTLEIEIGANGKAKQPILKKEKQWCE